VGWVPVGTINAEPRKVPLLHVAVGAVGWVYTLYFLQGISDSDIQLISTVAANSIKYHSKFDRHELVGVQEHFI
jgi:hypothetical protein